MNLFVGLTHEHINQLNGVSLYSYTNKYNETEWGKMEVRIKLSQRQCDGSVNK